MSQGIAVDEPAVGGDRSSVRVDRRVVGGVVSAVLLLVLVAVAAYDAGRQHGNHVRALTGRAYVGSHVAAVKIDGWSYGISKSVSWVDRDGTSHEDGWPTCLGPVGATVRVRFGEISVSGPQHDGWREVVWVDCRGATRIR